ncbi:HD domain-containing protein [Candidatus Electronema sp. JM]|uniref:HD domain-containing protein n=1 Tax=Candidatus Electronema sp. JM TaxID=3401571 RepID=UPI003AA99386
MTDLAVKNAELLFTAGLLDKLAAMQRELGGEIYLVGGTVRDLLLGKQPGDLDLTVSSQPKRWAEQLRQLTGGACVELGREEGTFRIVTPQGAVLDFSGFRQGTTCIEDDLRRRDLTVNALAAPLHEFLYDRSRAALPVLDPTGGLNDLAEQRICAISEQNLLDDPLRLLRVFRFAAKLGFAIEPETLDQVRQHSPLISKVAKERIAYELDAIMATNQAHTAVLGLRDCGLLWEILPELRAGVGMSQPASHHLDVFEHCLEALRQIELVLADLPSYFAEGGAALAAYLDEHPKRLVQVKWAAFLHDIGKPVCFGTKEDAQGGRITFYNHDLRGADLFTAFSRRLRRSREDTEATARLIAGHMRPFFLANNQRKGKLTLRACLRLIRDAGGQLPGLFLLAMADALAGKGEDSPKAIEEEVSGLFAQLQRIEQEHVAPVQAAPPLITGNDLITELHLVPGPLFRTILEAIEEAQMEHTISNRAEALALAAEIAAKDDTSRGQRVKSVDQAFSEYRRFSK